MEPIEIAKALGNFKGGTASFALVSWAAWAGPRAKDFKPDFDWYASLACTAALWVGAIYLIVVAGKSLFAKDK